MSDLAAPVKAIIKAIDIGIKLVHRVSKSARSATAATALQISESAPILHRLLEQSSQAIRDAYQQNVEACGEPFTKALVEDKTIQTRLKDIKNDLRDRIDECQYFEDEPESFDPTAFLSIKQQAEKCSTDCVSIFKALRNQLDEASLQTSGSDHPKDDRAQLTSMGRHMEPSQSNLEPLLSPMSQLTPTEPLRILNPPPLAPPSEPVEPKSPWVIDAARLIPKEAVHSRINANEEFLERRRQSRLMFNHELRCSTVSSISENRASEGSSDGPLSPLVTSPGTSASSVGGRGFRAGFNGFDMSKQRSQGHASQGTQSSRTSSILHDRQSVQRRDSKDSIFGLRDAAPASPFIVENLFPGTSGNIELWSPIIATAKPAIIENPYTWDPRAEKLQVPSGLMPVNIEYGDGMIDVNAPEQGAQQSSTQLAPTFTVRQMDYPIRPDSSFSKFGGFCGGAKAVTKGETGFKIIKRPAGHYSGTVSARCIACCYEVGWNDVEKDRLLDTSGIYNNSGIRFRQRFISKCHLKTNSIETPIYACLFCVEVHKTVEEHDATIFFSVTQLFKHIAKHPQPVPHVNGITVLYGLQAPNALDFDIHFTFSQPLVPEFAYAAIASKVATRPTAYAISSNHPKNGRSDSRDPDSNPVLHYAVGARIIGISFPDRFNGIRAIGYHDGLRGAFPTSTIRIDLPRRDEEVINTNSNPVAVAKWDFKLKKSNEDPWLKFSKGETITHIGFKYQDQWCWTGQNVKGQWGLFLSAFVDILDERGLFSTSPGSIKKGGLFSKTPSFLLGRYRSSNKHERKTSTNTGGSNGRRDLSPRSDALLSVNTYQLARQDSGFSHSQSSPRRNDSNSRAGLLSEGSAQKMGQARGMVGIREVVLEHLSSPAITSPDTQHGKGRNVKATVAMKIDDLGSPDKSQRFQAIFDVEWDVKEFMKEQFGEDCDRPVGSVIALTGSALCAQATTVQAYLKRYWPDTGPVLLDILQKQLNSEILALSEGSLRVDFGPFTDQQIPQRIRVDGSIGNIVEIAQQLAWLGSALRTSPSGQVAGSQCHIYPRDLGASFVMQFSVTPLGDEEKSCWQELFFNPVIVYGFPIEQRHFGNGLEIPIHMMAALGGASKAVEFNGGIVLKGFSSMFVPRQRLGDSVQWHYIRNEDDTRLPYQEADGRCTGRALLADVDFDSLTNTRAFLGWWGNTTYHLGTADANYDNIDYSDTREPGRSIVFRGGRIGFQNIAAGEVNFSPGPKDGKLHISRNGPYQRIVKYASRTPLVLYDTCEKRGWLVPSSAVIAHMTQTQHFRERFCTDGKPVEFIPTDPTLDVYEGAEKMLLKNFSVKLSDDDPAMGEFYFRDMVLNIWSVLENLMDKDIEKESTSDPSLHGAMRRNLRGWEFMDVVHERSPIRLKETYIQKSHGGWTDFVRDLNTVILFANGFEDVIKPAQESGLCHTWQRVPKDKDYLATSVSMLNSLYEEAGSRLTKKHLTSTHLQWHRGPNLFETCPNRTSYNCICDRLQQIVREPTLNFDRINTPVPLEERGAVIFGRSGHSYNAAKLTSRQREGQSLYSQENAPLLQEMDHAEVSVSSPDLSGDESPLHSSVEDSIITQTSQEEMKAANGCFNGHLEKALERDHRDANLAKLSQ